MKKIHLIYAACLLVGMGACAASVQKQVKDSSDVWKEYNTGAVLFEDKAPETLGSDIYHRIIPDAESYIKEQARTVLATLYNSPEDSIPAVHKIHYTLEDINGISAKGGGNGDVTIFYSTRHIEKSFAANDTAKLFFETRGVLLHELTHAYQLEPQGIMEPIVCSGHLSREWQMLCGLPMEDLTDRMPVRKAGTIWTVIVQPVISLSGCVITKILNSCVSSIAVRWRWCLGRSMVLSNIF